MLYLYIVHSFFYRKSSLALIRKMVHYINDILLQEICAAECPTSAFASLLVEVVAIVLDTEVNKG